LQDVQGHQGHLIWYEPKPRTRLRTKASL